MEKGKFFIVGRFGEKNTSHSQSERVRLNIREEHHKRNTFEMLYQIHYKFSWIQNKLI